MLPRRFQGDRLIGRSSRYRSLWIAAAFLAVLVGLRKGQARTTTRGAGCYRSSPPRLQIPPPPSTRFALGRRLAILSLARRPRKSFPPTSTARAERRPRCTSWTASANDADGTAADANAVLHRRSPPSISSRCTSGPDNVLEIIVGRVQVFNLLQTPTRIQVGDEAVAN